MSLCKACGSAVNWVKANGHLSCFNPDGSSHWDLCSQLKFERIKRTGEYVEQGSDKAYLTVFKSSGIQYVQQTSGSIRGRNYKPSGDCIGCCAPWEVCSMPCPDRLEAA